MSDSTLLWKKGRYLFKDMMNNYMITLLEIIENILDQDLDFSRWVDTSLQCLDEYFVVAFNVNVVKFCLESCS